MTQADMIAKAKAYAELRYNDGYGYQCWVECTDDDQWAREVEEYPTWEELKAAIDSVAEIWTAEYGEVTAEIF